MEWVRLYHDMPSDPKWRVIAKKSGQRIGDVIAVYAFMLTNASGNALKRGVTQGFVTEDVAAAIDLEEDGVTAILDAMEGKVVKSGELLGWEKRNPKREDNSNERVRKHRETHRNAVKRPELETEEDTEQKESSSAPPVATPTPKAKSRRSLPENFPDASDRDWAQAHWLAKGRADLCDSMTEEIAKFRDHHAGKATMSADWAGSWRTWTRNAMNFTKKPNGNRNGKSPSQTFHDVARDICAEILSPGTCEESGGADETALALLPARPN